MRVAIVFETQRRGMCDNDTIRPQELWDAVYPATQLGRSVLLDSLTRTASGVRSGGFQLGISGWSWNLS